VVGLKSDASSRRGAKLFGFCGPGRGFEISMHKFIRAGLKGTCLSINPSSREASGERQACGRERGGDIPAAEAVLGRRPVHDFAPPPLVPVN
jgi:hypothetical protein